MIVQGHTVTPEQEAAALAAGDWFTVAPHTHGTDGFFAAVMQRVT